MIAGCGPALCLHGGAIISGYCHPRHDKRMLAHPMSIDYSATQLDPEELAEHRARLQAESQEERKQLWQKAQTAGTIERTRSIAYREPEFTDDRLGRQVRERQQRADGQPVRPDPRKMQAPVRVRVRLPG